MDYEKLRKRMVKEQIVTREIKDKRVIDAFLKVERHRFVPQDLINTAYGDFPLPIGEGQTISQPYIVALMTEELRLEGGERVLEIGTGSGYQAAILAQLCSQVYTIERITSLAKRAQILLKELNYNNIIVKLGDGTVGLSEEAPFDRIMVTAATQRTPPALIEQLKDGGRLLLPLGNSFSQVLTLVEKQANHLNSRSICNCVFVPLIGKC
ncbi:MAG: protein-L-isoaspartate(D-aspartate) O-methyltransferase [Candidatus Omnitrophica bacterium]|nr:protein-L-isoaspartate(D-aspartate) O-methyltransferase [Candidatus Omnitrophota bacterium]